MFKDLKIVEKLTIVVSALFVCTFFGGGGVLLFMSAFG